MFFNCSKLKKIDVGSFSVYSIFFNMSYLFYNCQNLTSININYGNFRINDTREMFYNCSELTSIILILLK